MKTHPLLPILLMAIAGCATPPKEETKAEAPSIYVQRQTIFDEAEYAPYQVPGTGKITGQVFLKTVGGDVKFGAGSVVTLNPATTHGMEWYDIFMRQKVPATGDPRSAAFSRQTRCDGFGNFEFTGLPDGKYCLISGVVWSTGYRPTGATVGSVVDVKNGETIKVILTM